VGNRTYRLPRIYERTRLVIKQVYKIEMIVEINAQDDINLVDIKRLTDSNVYGIDITPIDIEQDQFKWVKAIKSLNEL